MIVACMRECGLSFPTSNDADFERVRDITVFKLNYLAKLPLALAKLRVSCAFVTADENRRSGMDARTC